MKRNIALIIGISLAIVTMMLMGNVITIAEKLGEVCHTVYVEYNNEKEKAEAEKAVARLWNIGKVVSSERGE